MRLSHCFLTGGLVLGFGIAAATLLSGCGDDSKTSGTHVEYDQVTKDQMQGEKEATEAAVAERRASRGKRGAK